MWLIVKMVFYMTFWDEYHTNKHSEKEFAIKDCVWLLKRREITHKPLLSEAVVDKSKAECWQDMCELLTSPRHMHIHVPSSDTHTHKNTTAPTHYLPHITHRICTHTHTRPSLLARRCHVSDWLSSLEEVARRLCWARSTPRSHTERPSL